MSTYSGDFEEEGAGANAGSRFKRANGEDFDDLEKEAEDLENWARKRNRQKRIRDIAEELSREVRWQQRRRRRTSCGGRRNSPMGQPAQIILS